MHFYSGPPKQFLSGVDIPRHQRDRKSRPPLLQDSFQPWCKLKARCCAGRHHCAGVGYGIIALIVIQSGVGWVEHLMTGAVVAVIGLNLAPMGKKEEPR
jgi:hypothetical protein